MARYLGGAAAAALLLALAMVPAQAQSRIGVIPDSCRQMWAFDHWAVIDCLRSNGTWERTVRNDQTGCAAGLNNINGALVCGGEGSAEGYGSTAPPRQRARQRAR